MKNYKWLVHTNNSNIPANKVNNYLITVVDENFKSVRAFEWVYDMDGLIDMNLFKYGGIQNSWDGRHGRVKIQYCEYHMPYSKDEWPVTVTAPMYNLNHKLLVESYTATVSISDLPDSLILLYEKCKEDVAIEMAKKFQDLYDKNSLDGGLSSQIVVSEKLDSWDAKVFFEKYVPTGFIKVAETWFSRDQLGRKRTLFMKEEDYQGENITIFVPPILMGATIGWNGENIKKVAEKLNASYINVQMKLD